MGIGLKQGMTFIDVGCGYGFFSIPAAKIVGTSGRVLGIDIDDEGLQSIKDSTEPLRLKNVETILGRAEEIIACRGCADVIFFGIVLHDFQDPYRVISNAKVMLRSNGILVDIDWRKEETAGMGPPISMRFDERQASDMISSQGLRITSVSRSGKYNYIITATKNDATL